MESILKSLHTASWLVPSLYSPAVIWWDHPIYFNIITYLNGCDHREPACAQPWVRFLSEQKNKTNWKAEFVKLKFSQYCTNRRQDVISILLTCLVLSPCERGRQICAFCLVQYWNKTRYCRSCWLSGSVCTKFLWHPSQFCLGVPRRWSQGCCPCGVRNRSVFAPPWTRWSGPRPSETSGNLRQSHTPTWGRRSYESHTRCGRSLLPLDSPGRGWNSSPARSCDSAWSYSEKAKWHEEF